MDGLLPTRRRSEKALNPPVGTVPLAQRGTQVAYYGLAGTLSHPGVEVVAYEVAFFGGDTTSATTPKGRRRSSGGLRLLWGSPNLQRGLRMELGRGSGGEEALQIYFFL